MAAGINKKQVTSSFFNFEQNSISIKEQSSEINASGESVFTDIKGTGLRTFIEIPRHIQVKQFLIEGSDAMTVFAGRPTQEAWFFIIPDGLSQEVIINIVDTRDRLSNGSARSIGLVLNPFMAQFKIYDEFQK